uniref:(northern house mosquito) hypothetical protein n=1 Tax=Culex pipiens TaxID=7175 RepID=A0A8D7ZYC0_CULPI
MKNNRTTGGGNFTSCQDLGGGRDSFKKKKKLIIYLGSYSYSNIKIKCLLKMYYAHDYQLLKFQKDPKTTQQTQKPCVSMKIDLCRHCNDCHTFAFSPLDGIASMFY